MTAEQKLQASPTDTVVEMVPVDQLVPHEQHELIYNDGPDEELLQSIEQHGIVTPLLITNEGVIISGNRRYLAAVAQGLSEVPATRIDTTDDLELLDLLVETNRYRRKTDWQISQEAKLLYEVEQERAARRQRAGTTYDEAKQSADGSDQADLGEQSGKTRDIVSKKIGAPRRKVDSGAKVANLIEIMHAHDLVDEANALEDELKSKSITAAYNFAKDNGWTKLLQVKQDEKRQEIAQQLKDDSSEIFAEVEHRRREQAQKEFESKLGQFVKAATAVLDYDVDPYWIYASKNQVFEDTENLAQQIVEQVSEVWQMPQKYVEAKNEPTTEEKPKAKSSKKAKK